MVLTPASPLGEQTDGFLFVCRVFSPSILPFSFWLAKLICPNLPLARGAAAAALSSNTPWVEKA